MFRKLVLVFILLKSTLEPKPFWKDFKNCTVNCAVLYEIMETGTP